MKEAGFKYEKHKKSYYVDRHEDDDVVSDRKTYLQHFFENEIYEHCWIQISKYNYLSLKYRNELRTFNVKQKDGNTPDDVVQKMNFYIEKHRTHFYRKEDKEMVELHVDDYYAYDNSDADNIPIGDYGGSLSVCLPTGSKPRICFGQDKAIFRSSQLNNMC